jgi:sortase A
MKNRVLGPIERALLAAGLALALWCAFVLVRAEYVRRMPVPPAEASAPRLPGEGGDPVKPPRVTVSLPAGTWIARLEAPSAKLTATILEGSDDRTLERGAGHIEGTAYPGQSGNLGIAGHRDTVFRRVRHVRTGDPLTVTTADRVYEYKVTDTWIVEPTDVWVLDPTSQSTLTLVTCYPFDFLGHAPRRFIVRADLVGQTERRRAGS